jgi:hypothetical protein
MRIPNATIADIEDAVIIRYVNVHECAQWNEHRKPGELRMFTGWAWFAKTGNEHQMGLKTWSACARDAYYRQVKHIDTPAMRRRQLRAVA